MVAWGRADGALTPDRPIDDDDGAKAAVCTTAVPRALPLAGPVSPVRSTFLRHTKSLATTVIVPIGADHSRTTRATVVALADRQREFQKIQ